MNAGEMKEERVKLFQELLAEWHMVEALELGSVVIECKEGPFVPHEEEGVLDLN